MKRVFTLFTSLLLLVVTGANAQQQVTFQLDMSAATDVFEIPEVNGTFNSWCGNCNAMSDEDGDNIWSVTVIMPLGSYEFKYSTDNWSAMEVLTPGMPCTITTDGFTNRSLSLSGDTILPVVCWSSCSSCNPQPPACPTLDPALQEGLVGYWPFCGNANDESGNGNDGVVNGATLTEDRFGNSESAYQFFDFTNIECPLNSTFFANDFTVSMWAKFDGYNSGNSYPTILIGQNYYLVLQFTDTTIPPVLQSFFGSTLPGQYDGLTRAEHAVGSWVHVILKTEGGISTIYFDGVPIASADAPSEYQGGTFGENMLFGGGYQLPAENFNGLLDDIGIWSRALTAEEITDLFSDYSPLVTYYLDNDGDTFGDPNSSVETNTGMPVGYSSNNVDCDDTNALINIPELPIFNSFGPFCAGSDIPSLPTISANGLEGLWSPAINNLETTTYTFTPNVNQCAYPGNYTVEILPIPQVSIINSLSCVEQVATITAMVEPLGNYEYNWLVPAEATNPGNVASFSTSIDGLYSVVVNSACFDSSQINTQSGDTIIACEMFYFPVCGCDGETYGNECFAYTQGITHYSFGECSGIASFYCPSTEATTEVSIQTSNTPTFGSFGPYCSGSSIPTLPTTSQNGISGSWSPAINNQETTTYTFTPDAGQCASSVTRTITITPILTPSFGISGPYCAGSSIPGLPTTSTNGITGNWSPAINNQETTTYTFTPNAGQCAPSVTRTIIIAQTVIPCYLDEDNDGWGIEGTFIQTCDCPAGYSDIFGDCDDTNNQSNPDASEVCLDQIDNNCNIEIDEECVLGCTSFDACNFDWLATIDDGSCAFNGEPCDDGDFMTMDDIIMNCFCGEIPIDIAAPHICGANGVHNPNLPYSIMTDQEGNTYRTIIIGEQEWMAENLKTSIYRNGDTIPYVTNDSEWSTLNIGAYCYYNNDATFNCPFGKLYNWYTVVDSRNVCPVGWHVPTDDELSLLVNYLDPNADGGNNTNISGGKMKSFGLQYWTYPNLSAANGSGFSGLPGGARYPLGPSSSHNSIGYWWSSTEGNSNYAWARVLDSNSGSCHRWGPEFSKRYGFSVRCLRDNTTGLIPGCTDPLACNYEDTATIENGSCLYPGFSCDDENILTENDTLDGSCSCTGTFITGCTDTLASNYNPLATINEGCEYIVPVDTLICNQITTPAGPGADWGLWLDGLNSAGLASTDWFRWSDFPSLIFSNDGSAHLIGDVVANNNLSNGWHIDITLEEGVDWSTWSAEGGLYMDNLGLNENAYTSWGFYKLVAGDSRLDGFGDFDGDLLFLSHNPLNYEYGWQFGMGANNRNSNNGGSGEFFYSGVLNNIDVSGHGSLTLEMACNYPESYSLNIFVYNDLNGNGTHDIEEPGLSNWPVMGNSIDGLLWTNNNGYYYLTLDTAEYEFTLLNTTDNWVSTTPISVTIDLTSGPATGAFGLKVIPGEAIVAAGPFTGFWDILHCTQGYESGVYLENIGSQAVSGFMTLTCDPIFTPNADSYFTAPPLEVGPGYALWNVEDFLPGENKLLSFHIDGPGVEYLNQSFTFAFDLTLFDSQGNMIYSDNWSVSPIVACAYDPNDITGFPEGLSAPHEEGYTIEHYILPDNMVVFRVRFQNTGTLPAEDIDIYIPINDSVWDLSTIEPLARSADMQVVCLHDDGSDLGFSLNDSLEHELPAGVSASDLLIFSFDDIFLPDSASNPEGSQGYVFFEMQAKHGLDVNTELNAQAYIYFEQNPPITTNETYHVIFDCNSFTPMVGDTIYCDEETILFDATQPYVDTYTWTLNYGLIGNQSTVSHPAESGNYELELTTENVLCSATNPAIQGVLHQVTVLVNDRPTLNQNTYDEYCEGEAINFNAQSNGTVYWSNGIENGSTISADQSFTVDVFALNEYNCSSDTLSWEVTVNPLPSAEVDTNNNVLTAVDGIAWQWLFNGVDNATTQSITASVSGNYQVEITNEFGCEATSDLFVITDVSFVHSWSTLHLYPNPMTTDTRLELPQGNCDIALYDITGACVRTLSNQQGTVVITRDALAAGVYQLQVRQGEAVKSMRLVVE